MKRPEIVPMSASTVGDRILIAVTRDGRFRARVARLTSAVNDACRSHGVTGLAAEALARPLGCAAVYPTNFKDAERIAVQWSGGGPLRTLFAELRTGGFLRGFVGANYIGERNYPTGSRGIGHGLAVKAGFVNVLKQSVSGAFSQSQVELRNGEVDEDMESWFQSSEQVPTRLRVLTGPMVDGVPREVCAIIVQLLPGAGADDLPSPEVLDSMGADAQLVDLLDAAVEGRPLEMLGESHLEYRCTCARDRIAAGIALLEVDELLDMINDDKGASVRCEFCAAHYVFDREDLESIMVKKVTDSPREQEEQAP
jgi:molecular chaperone Hsp33